MKFHLLSLSTIVILAFGSTHAVAQSFTDVTIGTSHICAIADTAEVECTTESFAERYGAPADLPPMIDIAAGDQHTCGINQEGQPVCWGATQGPEGRSVGAYNQLEAPTTAQPLVSIAAGDHHTCAIDVDGRVLCWGLDTNQQAQPPGDGLGANGTGFIQVEGGLNFTCGIETGGNIACWTNDSRFDNSKNVEGPFTDLDVSTNNACGLKEDGSIDCWFGWTEPPANGPYTDLVVSKFAVCGLNQSQTVDCTYDSRISPDEPVFPADVRFTAITSGSEVFSPTLPFCGITVSGSIECASNLTLTPPGAAPVNHLDSVNFVLTATRYSKNQIELFWNSIPLRFGREQVFVEVYRNDILVDTTGNSDSWYDPSEQTQNPVVYKIRAIDMQGNVGAFSSSITVDNISGIVTLEEENRFDLVQPMHTVDSVNLSRVGRSSGAYVVTWSGSTPGTDGLKGYEVRINNEPVVFNDGFIHRLESFESGKCNIISVAAVSEDGTIFDYHTLVTNRLSRTPFSFYCVTR